MTTPLVRRKRSNERKLVERTRWIFQSLGTPTNTAIQRYMNAKKVVPQLFVATGATK
jgi:branched-chain amino acid transport system substrate-binding protein